MPPLAEVLRAAAPFGGGVALVALLFTLIAWTLRQQYKFRSAALSRAQAEDVPRLVGDEIDKLKLSADKLSAKQQFVLVRKVLGQRERRHQRIMVFSVISLFLLALLALIGIMQPRQPTIGAADDVQCPVGRQRYHRHCVANKMVDFLVCLETNGAMIGLRVAHDALDKAGDNEQGEQELQTRMSKELTNLPAPEYRLIWEFCAAAARDAGLTLRPPDRLTWQPAKVTHVSPSGFIGHQGADGKYTWSVPLSDGRRMPTSDTEGIPFKETELVAQVESVRELMRRCVDTVPITILLHIGLDGEVLRFRIKDGDNYENHDGPDAAACLGHIVTKIRVSRFDRVGGFLYRGYLEYAEFSVEISDHAAAASTGMNTVEAQP